MESCGFFKREAALWIPVFFFICNGHCCQTQAVKCQFEGKVTPALYDFDKSRPLSRALNFKNNEPGLIKKLSVESCGKVAVLNGFFRTYFKANIVNQAKLT